MPTSTSSASEWPDSNHNPSNDNPSTKQIVWPDLLSLAENSDAFTWQPFRPGVTIHRLYGDGQQGPSAALLKYEPGATIPEHEHTGYEHIVILSGSQRDATGNHQRGTLVINPPGSSHDLVSEAGCIVLIIWEKPVRIKTESDKTATF